VGKFDLQEKLVDYTLTLCRNETTSNVEGRSMIDWSFLLYSAPLLTLALALLGIFFSKDGTSNRLTRVGYLILGLTVASGALAIYDARQKDLGSANSAKSSKAFASVPTNSANH